VSVVFSASVPKATLLLLSVSAGVLAFSVRLKVFDTPPLVAVSVAVWPVLTAVAVAVKLALVAPEAIVTEAGTVTELELLVKATVVAVVAAEVSDTVQASVPDPVSVVLVQARLLRLVAGGPAAPVPDSDTTCVAALLVMVSVPAMAPAVDGLKDTFNVSVPPGASVTGKLVGASENPVPATDIPVTVSAAVPEDVAVTLFVATLPSVTVPKAKPEALSVIPGAVVVPLAALKT
jgi:hypothetical protein